MWTFSRICTCTEHKMHDQVWHMAHILVDATFIKCINVCTLQPRLFPFFCQRQCQLQFHAFCSATIAKKMKKLLQSLCKIRRLKLPYFCLIILFSRSRPKRNSSFLHSMQNSSRSCEDFVGFLQNLSYESSTCSAFCVKKYLISVTSILCNAPQLLRLFPSSLSGMLGKLSPCWQSIYYSKEWCLPWVTAASAISDAFTLSWCLSPCFLLIYISL